MGSTDVGPRHADDRFCGAASLIRSCLARGRRRPDDLAPDGVRNRTAPSNRTLPARDLRREIGGLCCKILGSQTAVDTNRFGSDFAPIHAAVVIHSMRGKPHTRELLPSFVMHFRRNRMVWVGEGHASRL